jgi:hypothetical protein
MKKTLLFLSFTLAYVFVNGQCIPDPQFTAPGIYPDTTIGLSDAIVGQAYSQNITIITPTDTVVDILGQSVSVDIDSISLTTVTGLPNGFTYSCDPPSCGFPGGTIKCAELYSTVNPNQSDIGLYNIVFETTSYASNVRFLGTFTQDDIIDYYYINIVDNTTFTIDKYDISSFDLRDVFPNPASKNVEIQFISGSTDDIILNVYNLLGEVQESLIIKSVLGINTINLSLSSFKNGLYLYSINNGNQVLTKRMMVSN